MSEQLVLDRPVEGLEQQTTGEILARLGIDLNSLDHQQVFDEVKNSVADQPLPERSWEDGPDDTWICQTEYSHSDRLRNIIGARLGELVAKETVEKDEVFELRVGLASLKDRFITSLGEMIQTHPELKGTLQHDYERRHLVVGGHMMALDGKTKMSNMVERGRRKAEESAQETPMMAPLKERCAADVRWLQRAEQVPVGSMWFGASVYTEGASVDFYRELGWREFLSFEQWIYRVSESELVYGSYSIDPVEAEMVRQAYHEETGIEIPRNEPTDTWLDHSTTMEGTLEECRERIRALRRRAYAKVGDTRERYTVEEILSQNKQASDEIFNTMYLPITIAVERAKETGCKDPILQAFTKGLLDDPEAINREVYWQLVDIYNRDELSTKDASLLEQLVRYGSAQHFCEAIIRTLRIDENALARPVPVVPVFGPVDAGTLDTMANSLAMRVLTGARQGTTYGGCTRSPNLSRQKTSSSKSSFGFDDFDPFGLFDDVETESPETSEDAKLPSTINCIKCKQASPKEKVVHKDYWECPHCHYWVDVCTGAGGYRESESEKKVGIDKIWEGLGKLVGNTRPPRQGVFSLN